MAANDKDGGRALEKIRKILALLNGATSEGEARAASLALQRALAASGMTIEEVEDSEREAGREVASDEAEVGQQVPAWKTRLSMVIADNYRCKTYIGKKVKGRDAAGRRRVVKSFVFMGLDEDAAIAAGVYGATCRAAENCWARFRSKRGPFRGNAARETYLNGFVEGLERSYAEQRCESESMALALRVPAEVRQAFDSMGLKKKSVRYRFAGDEIRGAGSADGYGFGAGDRLAS